MNPPNSGSGKPRYASAEGPVNRRTALRETLAAAPVNPVARQRLQRSKSQYVLGLPLSQQLARRPTTATTSQMTIVLALCLTLSAVGLLIAWLQASAWMAAGAAGVGLIAGGLAWLRRSRAAGPVTSSRGLTMGFDMGALATLDNVLNQFAAEVPDSVLPPLVELKKTLVRIAPLLERCTVNEVFTQDDRFYVKELVRRYLPDTLLAYLQVPAAQREVPSADGRSAAILLVQQLQALQAELSQRERLLVQVASEALHQQQRFLQAKHRGQ